MRLLALALIGISASAQGQEPGWRKALVRQVSQSPENASSEDLQRFEENAREATPYLGAAQRVLTPGEYEANRDLVRRMASYLAAWATVARTPQLRFALRRANSAFAALRFAALTGDEHTGQGPVEPSVNLTSNPLNPPFVLQAPEVLAVGDADKAVYRELQSRYEGAAVRATTAWQSAEVLRRNLETQGMSLNTETAGAMIRLQLYFETVADAFHERDWDDARINLQRVEGETEKVLKIVGH